MDLIAPETTPRNFKLEKNKDKREATRGSASVVDPNKLSIFMGANVDLAKKTTVVAGFQKLLTYLLSRLNEHTASDHLIVRCPYLQVNDTNIVMETTDANIAADDIAIVVHSSFTDYQESHFIKETVDQLLLVLIEKTAGN